MCVNIYAYIRTYILKPSPIHSPSKHCPIHDLSSQKISLFSTPTLYPFPKIHKPNNRGCPIVASNHSVTERIFAFVNCHLQTIIQSLPSYIRDSSHFIFIHCFFPTPLPVSSLSPLMSLPCILTFLILMASHTLRSSCPDAHPPPALLNLSSCLLPTSSSHNFSFNSLQYL